MTIAITVIIQLVRQTIAITIRRRIGWVIGIKTQLYLVDIADTVAIAVRIAVVAQAVAIQVEPFRSIVREGIVIVKVTITITVIIQRVWQTIAIKIRRGAGWITGVEAQCRFVCVTDSIAIAVQITLVANAVAVQIRPFRRVIRESILVVQVAVTITVIVKCIRGAITVQIRRGAGWVVGIEAQFNFVGVADAITISVCIAVITQAVTVQI